jgi:hypothetical protein
MATLYINGVSFSTATAIYTDPQLTTCAPDGFYSFEGVVRELSGCVLQPIGICDECIPPCGQILQVQGNQGFYSLPTSLGSDIGAVAVRFYTGGIPDGIRVIYDGVIYNKLSCTLDGYHGTTTNDGFTYLGNADNICVDDGVGGNPLIDGSPYNISRYEWSPSISDFVDTGTTETVNVVAGDISTVLGWTGTWATMVIPKTAQTPTNVLAEISAPCPNGTGWYIEVFCPVVLTPFASTSIEASSTAACASGSPATYYNYPISGTAGNPAVNDFVFSDENGEFPLPAGWYKFGTSAFETNDFGVITSMVSC